MPEPATASPTGAVPASDYACALLTGLLGHGVRHLVVSPGSRSQALALAAAALESAGLVRLHVRIDERAAGFLALGIGVHDGAPAAVITTSGTAAAELHPAVLEAHHSGVPLIVVTADRPAELRGVRANQTTVQPGLYGRVVRFEADVPAPTGEPGETDAAAGLARAAVAAACGTDSRDPGPVHLNVAFREPLSGVLPDAAGLAARIAEQRAAAGSGGTGSGGTGPGGTGPGGTGPGETGSAGTGPGETGSDVAGPDKAGPGGADVHGADMGGADDPAGDAAAIAEPGTTASSAPVPAPSHPAPDAPSTASAPPSTASAPPPRERTPLTLSTGPRTIVIAGHGAGPDAEELAHAAGWPLIAEVTSGSRYGRELIVGYRELLADPEIGGRVERAIVFGHPTLSREVPALLSRPEVEVIVVAPHGVEVVDPGRRGVRVASAVRPAVGADAGSEPEGRAWLGTWVVASREVLAAAERSPAENAPDVAASRSLDPRERIAFAKAEYAVSRAPVTRRMLVETLWRFTWPHDRLVLAASRLIREADRTVLGKKINVHANRGLAGIDGTIATATGLALAAAAEPLRPGRTGVTRVLIGDLALLHDAGAMLFGEGEERPIMQVVVGNDGGGTIFDGLEVARSADAAAYDRVMLTPQRADLAALAAAYGWEHTRAATHAELERALSTPGATPRLIEVPLPRE